MNTALSELFVSVSDLDPGGTLRAIARGADPNAKLEGQTALAKLIRESDESVEGTERFLDTLKALLEGGASPAADGLSKHLGACPLAHAVIESRLGRKGFELLVVASKREDLDRAYNSATLLCWAAQSEKKFYLDVILERGADPNAPVNVYGPERVVCLKRFDPSVLKRLLESGADPNPIGDEEPILPAAAYGFMTSGKTEWGSCVELALRGGADPFARDEHGRNGFEILRRASDDSFFSARSGAKRLFALAKESAARRMGARALPAE